MAFGRDVFCTLYTPSNEQSVTLDSEKYAAILKRQPVLAKIAVALPREGVFGARSLWTIILVADD